MINKIQYEIVLVEEALAGRPEELQTYLDPLVRNIAAAYELGARRAYPSIKLTQDDLERVEWMSLDRALHSYMDGISRQKLTNQETYSFSSYFTWCIRQAALDEISRRVNSD